ncbi:MAG: PKD domain-containing protein [Gammaproteobacteria bacterium]|nr:PKD domain-containing protein [Gammaproteobacteria bacterium]
MKQCLNIGIVLFIQLLLSATAVAGEKVNQSVDLAGSRQATWYLPDEPAEGWILLQHGFQRNKNNLDHLATTFMNNGIMVLTINSNSTGGNPSLAREIADDLIDATLTPPSGFSLPEKLILSGHSAGALMMSYMAGRLVERNYQSFSGLIMLDPVDKDNGMQPNNQSVIDYGRKVLSVLANSSSCNSSNNALAPLQALTDSYVGIKLTNNSKHTDAEGDSSGGIITWVCGSPVDQNVNYLQDFAVNWALDMISGEQTDDYYPGGNLLSDMIGLGDAQIIEGTPPPTEVDFLYSADELTLSFVDNSNYGDIEIIAWNWWFGDGSSSVEQNPIHTYSSAGDFNVLLSVTDEYGNTNSVRKVVTVNPTPNLPTASFSYTMNHDIVTFTDTSTDADGSIVERFWDFGDGSSSTNANPVHRFELGKEYKVILEVTDNDGNKDLEVKYIYIMGRPVCPPEESCLGNHDTRAQLEAERGGELFYYLDVPENAENLEFSISGGTGDADIYIKRGSVPTTTDYDYRPYLNGNNERVFIPNPEAGTWNIIIRGYQSFSDVTLYAGYDEVWEDIPVADFSFGNDGLKIYFEDKSSDGNGEIIQHAWDFGDGSTSIEENPVHEYAKPGIYTVTLIVEDNDGNTDKVSKNIEVNDWITTILNDVPVNNLSGDEQSAQYFYFDITEYTQSVSFDISGGDGDADIYIRYGEAPTTSLYDYRPYKSGNNESVTIENPQQGGWYIMIRGYTNYSGVTLRASYFPE